MEELSATKYGTPSAVIARIEASRQSKFPVSNDLSPAPEVVMALLKAMASSSPVTTDFWSCRALRHVTTSVRP